MRHTETGTGFSATDLSSFSECSHRTRLDLAALRGTLHRPPQNDLQRRLMQLRGGEHERRVLEHYQSSGKHVETITSAPGTAGLERAAAETLTAMKAGVDVVYQGVLADPDWSGRPDFLVRVDDGGPWGHHYEAVDAKLAQEAKAGAVLQLCVYTDQLTRVQGIEPAHFHVAARGTQGEPVRLAAADYMAYYRRVRGWFDEFVASGEEPYPEPVEHCGVCLWWRRCEDRRRGDDHLSLVAGSTRRQRDRLADAGVARVTELATLAPDRTIDGVARDALVNIREQARIQVEGRTAGKVLFELLEPRGPNVGLAGLPVPTPGDLFLDLEGDAFVNDHGLEYLFGLVELGTPELDDFTVRSAAGEPRYHAHWATDDAAEKRAFESVIDRITRGRQEFADLHVFHYGHREADALRKLSCRHKTRESQVDDILRDGVLVDLHTIVRHSVRASVEAYTLKQLEGLHGFARTTEVRDAGRAMLTFGWWLETGELDATGTVDELRGCIEAYNREDCLSTWRLRDWLEARRPELEHRTGTPVPRLTRDEPKDAAEDRKAQEKEAADVIAALTSGLPEDASADTDEQASRRLMADLVEWHRREAKSGWWEYFRTRDLAPQDWLTDRAALAGLVYEGAVRNVKKSIIHRYAFPQQEHAIRKGPGTVDPTTRKTAGEVVAMSSTHIELKRGVTSKVAHPQALLPGGPIVTPLHTASLIAIGASVAAGRASDACPVAHNLLLRIAPGGDGAPDASLVRSGESTEAALARLVQSGDGTVLAVQGPPGSGKTYQAAAMISALLQAGKRVGVTANSHEVIRNVLREVYRLPGHTGVHGLHLQDTDDATTTEPFEIDDNKPAALKRLQSGDLNLIGGTSFTWAHPDFERSVDVLVVDEAGQISLANALAVSRACSNMVLFGDPAQLDQPQKGVHPPGADASALEHLLGEHQTMPADRGIFLPETRRMHPAVCDFVSKVFYEGRLRPDAGLGLDKQAVEGPGPFRGAGLRYVPVRHDGSTNQSPEEVERIAALVSNLLSAGATFTDRAGVERPISAGDVLVVTPYNAQVAALRRALPPEVRVGTVDKFQGQQAPIVIYSMATSTAQDAPRGMDFLYSLNRLNVAVSRAQAIAVLVASPALTRTACKTPRQMKLVNALCAYLEHVEMVRRT